MKIVNVEPRESIASAKIIRSTTAGLTSGYQRTGSTTFGASAIATTGGCVLIDIESLPWYSPQPLSEPDIETIEDLVRLNQDELESGYRTMAGENSRLAEESLPVASEVWPTWEE